MAEGPLVHHYARQLGKILQGKAVDVEFGIRKLKESEPSLAGFFRQAGRITYACPGCQQ